MFNLSLPALAIIAAAIAASYGATYLKGRYDGSEAKQAEWTAAINQGVTEAEKNRKAVDGTIPLSPPASELCNDKWNRNPC